MRRIESGVAVEEMVGFTGIRKAAIYFETSCVE
jgi:hypothetical protein